VWVGWSSVQAAGYSMCYNLQPGYYFSLPGPNFQPTATQERDDQCGNQHYSHELLMMGKVVPETCSAYKYNKIISSIYLVFIPQLYRSKFKEKISRHETYCGKPLKNLGNIMPDLALRIRPPLVFDPCVCPRASEAEGKTHGNRL